MDSAVLDPRLLRAFVAIAEQGSFSGAASRLNMTQSTISQQLARLEAAIGHQLVDRGSRPVLPTPAGERLIGHAKRLLALQSEAAALLSDPAGTEAVRIGVAEDILDAAMAAGFAGFSQDHREIRLDVTTGLSGELGRRYRNGEFDVIAIKQDTADADCVASFAEPMAWFESNASPRERVDPLPLVTFSPGGLYRDEMFQRIEEEQRRWYVGFTGNSLTSVLVAVEAGLGVSLLPCLATKGRTVKIYEELGRERPMALSVYAWETSGRVGDLLAKMTALLTERAASIGSSVCENRPYELL
jgi:DNA-binding transcriptional LysR family regulator